MAALQGSSSNFTEITAVASHELAEAITDPNVNYKTPGWYDAQLNDEIGDLAEGNYTVLPGYQVQQARYGERPNSACKSICRATPVDVFPRSPVGLVPKWEDTGARESTSGAR
jgi:hypothetical protein